MSTNPASQPAGEPCTARHRRRPAQEPTEPGSDLWRRFKDGDEQAAADLYDRYSPLKIRSELRNPHPAGVVFDSQEAR
jgi:hypothetical protein